MNLFNVGAFFVLFREALEASIILGVLLRYLDTTVSNNPELLKKLKRQVWFGTVLGLGISIVIGVIITVIFYVLKTDVLGDNMPLFEGILQSVAVVLLTWLAFKMLSVNEMYSKWEKKIALAAASQTPAPTITCTEPSLVKTKEKGQHHDSVEVIKSQTKTEPNNVIVDLEEKTSSSKYGFIILTFSIIIREGLESVIFIAGVGGGEPRSLFIPGILGIVLGTIIGVALYKGSGSLDLKIFFKISTAILLVFAAGLACNAAWEIEEWYFKKIVNYNVEGVGEEEEDDDFKEVGGFEDIPERTMIIWNASSCCSEYKNGFFQILSTLVGWKSKMSLLCALVYLCYWFLILTVILLKKLRLKTETTTKV